MLAYILLLDPDYSSFYNLIIMVPGLVLSGLGWLFTHLHLRKKKWGYFIAFLLLLLPATLWSMFWATEKEDRMLVLMSCVLPLGFLLLINLTLIIIREKK